MQAMEISRTGLDVEWRRLDVIAENLANANTVYSADGRSWRPQHLISGPRGDFAAWLEKGKAIVDGSSLAGVMIYGIEADQAPPRIVHEPDNPQSDADGNIAYPAVNHSQQMTLMIKTARAYEANLVALNAARQMYNKALDLGRRA